MPIPEEVIKDWIKSKKRIQDRINRIKKRILKFEKQKKHFEMRLRVIAQHELAASTHSRPKEPQV